LSVPNSIISQLESFGVEYELISLNSPSSLEASANYLEREASKSDYESLIRAVMLESNGRTMLAVLPYNAILDMVALADQTQQDYKILSEQQKSDLFRECTPNSFPPIPELFSSKTIIDRELLDMPQAIIQSGNASTLIKIDKINLNLLFQECESFSFAIPHAEWSSDSNRGNNSDELSDDFTAIRMKQRIDETYDLPTMPDIAQDIMKLRVDPAADAAKLAQIVGRDPSLAAQVMSWASSPYYGYQGEVDSLQTAIARVLGFELVMNLALGISIGKSLKVPMDGPLGLRAFWKHAVYCANLSEKLCRIMPVKQRPERGLIYLSGLLHNFGNLLLGHIFPPQFKLINTAVAANNHLNVADIENHILGVNYQDIGAWLMENWNMPEEVITAVRFHNNQGFWDEHAVYPNIILVANTMLKQMYTDEPLVQNIPRSTFELLCIDESAAEDALQSIRENMEGLDIMSNQLVA
jgi:HD-like signal output (HDOD) protein/prolyl-tRNA editing enzyme YbaK/EbsC (Cys-tRNA(Pro) deacylase)